MKEEEIIQEMKHCRLCPRQCGADRTVSLGRCSVGAELTAARAALHHWEEPCISGNQGSGAVFFSGCPLHCVYCQNREISGGLQGRSISVSELVDIFLSLQEQGAHNINLVTGVMFVPQIIGALDRAREQGLTIPVVYNSSGYERVETLRRLEGYVDIYLPDLKYMREDTALRYSACPDYFEKATLAIDEMVRQTGAPVFDEHGMLKRGVIVRHLCLPEHGQESREIIRWLYERYGDNIWMSIMSQYTPVNIPSSFSKLQKPLSERAYEEILDFAEDLGVEQAFIQEGGAAEESFIPTFDYTGLPEREK